MASLKQYFERMFRPYVLDRQLDELLEGEAHSRYLADTWVLRRESHTDKVRKFKIKAEATLPETINQTLSL